MNNKTECLQMLTSLHTVMHETDRHAFTFYTEKAWDVSFHMQEVTWHDQETTSDFPIYHFKSLKTDINVLIYKNNGFSQNNSLIKLTFINM